MSFFFATPPDGARPYTYHRETSEDLLTAPRTISTQQTARSSPQNGSSTANSASNPVSRVESSSAPSIPRRNIVFPDPVAFRYLEDESCVAVVERRGILRGYELYLVEQWACSRQSPTLVIVTYTGDEEHSVVVGVLSVPVDEALWSTKLRVYFKATRQYLARPKGTQLGEVMVTNLSSFPSALTVIPVPDGDIRKHRLEFIVNENLKRMGCSGRSGLTLSEPAEGTRTKFLSLYKVSDKIPLATAVTELVKLCQVALYVFEKLEPEYIDGLLCDVTERAIGNWWTEVGAEHYNFEPNDGVLGPTTVAALLGMLMGARNRLYWYGCPVAKDAFDIECLKRGIGHFQKSFKIEKTRRLDRQTLVKLHNCTAKAAAGEGWGVQKAVKSRMKEIGGNRGEIVMGMVSGKDKGGMADIETLDLERFISFAYGERAKWLWYGKPRRTAVDHPERDSEGVNPSFGRDVIKDESLARTQTIQGDEDLDVRRQNGLLSVQSEIQYGSALGNTDNPAEKDALRRNVLKSVAGKMSDARSGLGRIKTAVGGSKRGHAARTSISDREDLRELRSAQNTSFPNAGSQTAVPGTPGFSAPGRAFTWQKKPGDYLDGYRREQPSSVGDLANETRDHSSATSGSNIAKRPPKLALESDLLNRIGSEVRNDILPAAPPTAESLVGEGDLEGPLLDAERRNESPYLSIGLSRRHSLEVAQLNFKHELNEARWARRVSFSEAEEAILMWEEVVNLDENAQELIEVEALAELARHLNQNIEEIKVNVNPWVEEKLKTLALLDERYARDKDGLQSHYQQLNEACQRVRYSSNELLAEERASLTESVKEIDVLVARLDYEINALVSKAVDVEDGVQTFERQVEDLEKRAAVLKTQLETESWVHWFFRSLTGVGSGPHITRGTT
ncbi:uncharacterized protein F5Z01DRAFT_650504 [Emericellopsis atlantica]|uniref:STB6-like N-terminal domain-containing protein n=1 Tax=Emericellopsis atlantica TaxID=2614577 RepID=A0A9P7ZQD4_9HYPO|nr:uncharacterized protein F5Z01DRAFT_650504 [Emericellopsis atlantica]KAG9255906.1 hypothetical protein F5Z01DRAFT_650504 [Emericellopsis atlantica]